MWELRNGICGISMAFESHICIGTYMFIAWKIKVAVFFGLVCSLTGGQHVEYIIRSHGQKGHVASHFDYLDPRNVMVPLMMLFSLHNVDASTIGVT